MRISLSLALALALLGRAGAAEVTVKNDSLTDFGNAAIVWGFVAGEKAASWLTSPCEGRLVAVQIFWRSPSGTQADVIGNAIDIYRGGTFPLPGALAQTIGGPVLADNALNEWRYLDENNTLPLSVPVVPGEPLVIAFEFAQAPQAGVDPSVVRDTDGITPGRNAIHASMGGSYTWVAAESLGVAGDWVIRAVFDCQAVATNADVAVSMHADRSAYVAGDSLRYTIVVSNVGPAAAATVALTDVFPAAFQTPVWTCQATSGATCPVGAGGNIYGVASLPADSDITFQVDGTVAAGTTGALVNSLAAVVVAPAQDPDSSNNSASLMLEAVSADAIFADGFDPDGTPRPVPARASGRRGG